MQKMILITLILFISNTLLAKEYPTDDINSPSYVDLSEMRCISDGVKKFTNLRPSDRYLSLLFAVAYQNANLGTMNEKNIKYNDGLKQSIQRRVIENIQAYGFCVDKKIDSEGHFTSDVGYANVLGFKKDNIDEIRGIFVNSNQTSFNNLKKPTQKYFGFSSFDKINNVFFNPDWSKENNTSKERQKYFRDRLSIALNSSSNTTSLPSFGEESFSGTSSDPYFEKNEAGDGAKECLSQLDRYTKSSSNSIFNLNEDIPEENVEFCKLISKECGLASNSFCKGEPAKAKLAPVKKDPTPVAQKVELKKEEQKQEQLSMDNQLKRKMKPEQKQKKEQKPNQQVEAKTSPSTTPQKNTSQSQSPSRVTELPGPGTK